MTTTPVSAAPGALGPGDGLSSVDDARARLLALCPPLGSERVPLTSIALDPVARVLSSLTTSLRALPPFDNSAMDGYGVRAADIRVPGDGGSGAQGTQLRIVGTSLAGHGASEGLTAGTCVAITTGAPLSPGIDAVVMRELCDESQVKAGIVVVKHAPKPGEHLRRRGEDVVVGGVVGAVGDVVTPARLNLLLSAGHVNVDVFRRPTVGVLASGDELREIGEGAFQEGVGDDIIVNSNAWAVAMTAQRHGARVRLLGIAGDSLAAHVAKMDVDDVDVLVTIGGVSMGSHDFVRPALEQLGATLHLWKIAMRPGKPLAVGTLPRRGRPIIVLGLPGNPVSAQVTFALFGVPLLRALQGHRDVLPTTTTAVLRDERAFVKKKGLAFFARAVVDHGPGGPTVTTLERQGSGQISGLAAANALCCFAADAERIEPGAVVEVVAL